MYSGSCGSSQEEAAARMAAALEQANLLAAERQARQVAALRLRCMELHVAGQAVEAHRDRQLSALEQLQQIRAAARERQWGARRVVGEILHSKLC